MKKITNGNDVFEVGDFAPNGYEVWNIGNHMVSGYVPFCRLSCYQPFQAAGI